MLIYYVAQYYKFLLLASVIFITFKIIISFSFNENLRGMHGLLFAIFKWYDEQEQEAEDNDSRRITMRVHNIVTLFVYFSLILIILANVIFKFLAH